MTLARKNLNSNRPKKEMNGSSGKTEISEGLSTMSQKIKDFYKCQKDFSEIVRTRTEIISTQEFKEKAMGIYEAWKIEIEPSLRNLKFDKDTLENLDALFEIVYVEATSRVAYLGYLKENLRDIHSIFLDRIIVALKNSRISEPTANLMESTSFLGLDTNWSVAVCALQLQEVAVTIVAEKAKIGLDKANVDRILNAKIPPKDFSFNHQYEAFRKEVKRLFNVDMPFLITQFRRMRVKVLHEGYNPEPEEKDSLVSFTIGLLQKLNSICEKL
jgi:hypothetical protein